VKALPVENLTVIAGAISTASPVKAREAIVKQRSELVGSIGPIGCPSITRRQRQ
jgi:hypothetical protein